MRIRLWVYPFTRSKNTVIPLCFGGGQITTEYPQVFSVFYSTTNAKMKMTHAHKNYTLPPFEPTPYTTSFVNTMEELRVLQQHYSTSFVKFPIIFPMKAQEYRWPTRGYIDYLTRCIGTSRHSIKINACMARRLPLSLTAAAVCVLGIGLHEW